jgi:Cu/Ag efflux protein CusF
MPRIIRSVTITILAAGFLATMAIAQETTINGEVKKIDESAGKITLKHGPAKSLGMDEGMTMVYRVKDPAMLNQIKAGDKVKFEAEKTDGGIMVTKIQKSK